MDDVTLSIGIAHVPTIDRVRMLANLQSGMGGLGAIYGQAVRYTVASDLKKRGYAGIWPTMKTALASIGSGATHHLVMQDDVEPCASFLPGVRELIGYRPDHIIQLFSMRTTLIDKARAKGDMWWTCRGNVFTQAMVWPVPVLRDFLAWERDHIDPAFPNDDQRISMYTLHRGIDVWCTTPCLVEHVGYNRSEIGHPATKNRVARWFLGDDSPLVFDWRIPDDPIHICDPGDYTRQAIKAIGQTGYYHFTPTEFMVRNSGKA